MELIDNSFKGVGGIYQIKNIINGKLYIGRTKCFYTRCSQYRGDFKNRRIRHINRYMMRSIDKYGFSNFKFRVIEICEDHHDRELFWMNHFESYNRGNGYNLRRDSTGGGMLTHPDTSRKISERLREEWSSGLRSDHSDKLKASWNTRDRDAQADLMSKNLTKWVYSVDGIDVLYRKLAEMGLSASLSTFSKRGVDTAMCKGHTVSRRRLHVD